MLNNHIGFLTEDIYIVVTYKLMNFNIGTVIRSQCNSPVKHKFHVTGT